MYGQCVVSTDGLPQVGINEIHRRPSTSGSDGFPQVGINEIHRLSTQVNKPAGRSQGRKPFDFWNRFRIWTVTVSGIKGLAGRDIIGSILWLATLPKHRPGWFCRDAPRTWYVVPPHCTPAYSTDWFCRDAATWFRLNAPRRL